MEIRIGFIGLGLMGFPMAKNILKAGFSLSVYNRSLRKTKELLGATIAKSPMELGQTCDVVITMVTGPEDVEEVCNEIATNPKKGLIIIDMSTIGPTAAKKIAKKLFDRGVEFVDAPVTGSVVRATSGELTIFIGGDSDVVETVKPVLLAMGTTLHYMGSVGMGQAIKLVNNYFVAAESIALSEGMMLADSMGLDRKQVAEVLQSASTGMSPVMKLVINDLATRTYPLIFSLSNMQKDITLVAGEMKGKNLPFMSIAKAIFDKGIKYGLGEKNFSSIHQVVEKEEVL